MTKEELITRINDLEWEDFEAKEAKGELPKNVWETVSAFANTSGGWIVLGVKQVGKKFTISGVNNLEKLEQDFLGTLRSQKFNAQLRVFPSKYDIDGKKVLAFYIPSSATKPIYYGNPFNTFIRIGSGDQRATEMEIMQMYHDQSFGIHSELTIPNTSIDMLNMDTLHSYRAYLNADKSLPQCKEIPAPTIEAAFTRYTYRIPEQENLWEAYLIIYRRLRTLIDTPFKLDSERGVNVEDKRQWDVLRITFPLKNKIATSTVFASEEDIQYSNLSTLQENLAKKLGTKLGVIIFLNEKLEKELNFIESEAEIIGRKLEEGWEKVGRK